MWGHQHNISLDLVCVCVCVKQTNKFTADKYTIERLKRKAKLCTYERENRWDERREKNERASFIWREKFCLGDRKIAQHRVINYETIAKMWKRPWLRAFIYYIIYTFCVYVPICYKYAFTLTLTILSQIR